MKRVHHTSMTVLQQSSSVDLSELHHLVVLGWLLTLIKCLSQLLLLVLDATYCYRRSSVVCPCIHYIMCKQQQQRYRPEWAASSCRAWLVVDTLQVPLSTALWPQPPRPTLPSGPRSRESLVPCSTPISPCVTSTTSTAMLCCYYCYQPALPMLPAVLDVG